MNRISSFLLGMVVGALLLFLSMNFYIVRAKDGVHFVPKIAAKVEIPYYDIRNYTLQDWQGHQALALAIIKSNKQSLMEGSAVESFRRTAEELMGRLSGS